VPRHGHRLQVHGCHGLPFLVGDKGIAAESGRASASARGGKSESEHGPARNHNTQSTPLKIKQNLAQTSVLWYLQMGTSEPSLSWRVPAEHLMNLRSLFSLFSSDLAIDL